MKNLGMTTRPGYTGQLNAKILHRIQYLSEEIGQPDLQNKFKHLHAPDGSWRTAAAIPDDADLAGYIDHTQLKADASREDIAQLCEEAVTHRFKAVCVNGCHVAQCRKLLDGTGVRVACVCGFPLGQMTSAMKVAEATEEISNGAHEVDMVINIGDLKGKRYASVFNDIKGVCNACEKGNAILKVIFETCLLSEEEIIDACIMSVAAGAGFVKTSTGFSTSGATPEAVDIMLAVVGNEALVKASGGVRDRATAMQYVEAGVRRIGTSSGVAIVSP